MNASKIVSIAALFLSIPFLAGESEMKAQWDAMPDCPDAKTCKLYKYGSVTFKVYPPANGRMEIEHSGVKATVRIDTVGDRYDPGNSATAKEALDNACERVLDAIERRRIADQNRPHLQKGLEELYEELATNSESQ